MWNYQLDTKRTHKEAVEWGKEFGLYDLSELSHILEPIQAAYVALQSAKTNREYNKAVKVWKAIVSEHRMYIREALARI